MKQLQNLTAVKRYEIKAQADLDNMARIAKQYGFDMSDHDKYLLENYTSDYVMVFACAKCLQETHDKGGLDIISLEGFLSYDKDLLDETRYTEEMRLNDETPKVGDKVILNLLEGCLGASYCGYTHNGEVMEVIGISEGGYRAQLKSTESKFECSITNAYFLAMDGDRSGIYIHKTGNPTQKTSVKYLQECIDVQKQRGKDYDSEGTGERSFSAAAKAFNAVTGKELNGSDVCLMLTMVKLVRQNSNPTRLHEDSLLDGVSYLSLWAEELNKELNS